MKKALLGFAVFIIGVIIFALLYTGGIFFNSATGVIEKTMDSDNVIHEYEYFKQQYRSILAISIKIRVSQQRVTIFKDEAGPRKEWDFEDKTEYARLQSIETGLRYQHKDMVAEYNARSKMVNRNIFKTGELPELINGDEL